MAERNRRGRGAADDHDDEPIEDVSEERGDSRGGGTAVKARPATREPKFGLFRRIGRFIREVVAELRKVIWPTRKELVTYAAVVVVFIAVMTAIIVLLDQAFARAVLAVFGG